eukprot:10059096-Karenia_brevis.AAC.1
MRCDQQNQSTAQAGTSSARNDGASIMNDHFFSNLHQFFDSTAVGVDALDPDDAASSSLSISIADENSDDED